MGHGCKLITRDLTNGKMHVTQGQVLHEFLYHLGQPHVMSPRSTPNSLLPDCAVAVSRSAVAAWLMMALGTTPRPGPGWAEKCRSGLPLVGLPRGLAQFNAMAIRIKDEVQQRSVSLDFGRLLKRIGRQGIPFGLEFVQGVLQIVYKETEVVGLGKLERRRGPGSGKQLDKRATVADLKINQPRRPVWPVQAKRFLQPELPPVKVQGSLHVRHRDSDVSERLDADRVLRRGSGRGC